MELLYTNEISKVLEHQPGGPGTPRLFKIKYYNLGGRQTKRMGHGVELGGIGDCWLAREAAHLAAQMAVALMKAGFKAEDVLQFSRDLEVEEFGPGYILCWPDYPNKF